MNAFIGIPVSIPELDGRLAALEAAMSALTDKLDEVFQHAKAAETRVTASIESLKGKVDELKAALDAANAGTPEVMAAVDKIEAEIDAIGQDAGTPGGTPPETAPTP